MQDVAVCGCIALPPCYRVNPKKAIKKESRAGWPGFSWRRVGCGYIAARRELALKLPLGWVRAIPVARPVLPRPVPDRQSPGCSVQVKHPGSQETDRWEDASSVPGMGRQSFKARGKQSFAQM